MKCEILFVRPHYFIQNVLTSGFVLTRSFWIKTLKTCKNIAQKPWKTAKKSLKKPWKPWNHEKIIGRHPALFKELFKKCDLLVTSTELYILLREENLQRKIRKSNVCFYKFLNIKSRKNQEKWIYLKDLELTTKVLHS